MCVFIYTYVHAYTQVAATYQGMVVQAKGAPSAKQWHEQACEHFGLRGRVRLCQVIFICVYVCVCACIYIYIYIYILIY